MLCIIFLMQKCFFLGYFMQWGSKKNGEFKAWVNEYQSCGSAIIMFLREERFSADLLNKNTLVLL